MAANRAKEMDRRRFLKTASAGAASFALAPGFLLQPAAASTSTRPNILFLMADQLRSDCLGCMGNQAVHTPNLDAIAREGVVFTNAYSSTPTCTPARAGLLTGMSPWHHGMLGYGRVARHYRVELPRLIREAGYYTFGIGKMHWYPQRALHGFHGTLLDESGRVESPGFVSDYHRWFMEAAPGKNPDATGLGWNDYRAWPYVLPEALHPTRWIGQTAVDFLRNYNRPEPFMLKVSFERPHSPYDPPPRFWEMYQDGDLPAPHVGKWAARFASHKIPPATTLWHGDLGVNQAKRSRHGYYGNVSFVDEEIGRIISVLKERGWYENTLIIFFADHGDMLGDHNLWRKSYAYEGSAHIPMLLRWPTQFGHDERRGQQMDQPVELRDVLPTFLDAAAAKFPEGIDGRSLLDLVRGQTRNWREAIDLEHDVCYSVDNHWNAMTDGRWKYIFHAYDGHEQLFHLEEDPGELHDLAGDPGYQTVLREWRDRLVEHLSERGEPFVKNGRLLIRRERMLYSPNYPGQER